MNAIWTYVCRKNRSSTAEFCLKKKKITVRLQLKMDVELLIAEVEKRPVLWDVNNELYRDRNEKNNEWMDVATVVFENFGEKKLEQNKKLLVSTDYTN